MHAVSFSCSKVPRHALQMHLRHFSTLKSTKQTDRQLIPNKIQRSNNQESKITTSFQNYILIVATHNIRFNAMYFNNACFVLFFIMLFIHFFYYYLLVLLNMEFNYFNLFLIKNFTSYFYNINGVFNISLTTL